MTQEAYVFGPLLIILGVVAMFFDSGTDFWIGLLLFLLGALWIGLRISLSIEMRNIKRDLNLEE